MRDRLTLMVVTGDIAAGPQPTQVLDRLEDLGDRVRLVRGNADRDLVTMARGGDPPEGTAGGRPGGSAADTRARGSVGNAPASGRASVVGFRGRALLATALRATTTRSSSWTAVPRGGLRCSKRYPHPYGSCAADIRTPFARLVDRRWEVNSGSTGMPYGSVGVPWAILDTNGVQLRSTTIDPEQVAEDVVADSSFPDVRSWVSEYVLRPPSDIDALVAFAAQDGRVGAWND
jgi:hypothetical protein